MKELIKYIIIFFIILFVFTSKLKCIALQNQLDDLRKQTYEQVDSLNQQHLNVINVYESEISKLKLNIDSLVKVKNKVITKRDTIIVSENISLAAELLKQNLES